MNALFRRVLSLSLMLAVLLSLTACGKDAESPQSTDRSAVYNGLFDTGRVHSIDVTISPEDWEDLRANPLSKTKYEATVVIDGETLQQVSFATKGNTSLSAVASDPDSDRYSFKLNFGKYNKNQSYHGLNKLSLNNLYADATYMKDYLSYELFRQVGVDAPLVSYVWLTVNGADHGLYIAIEDVSESFLDRTQDGEGVLYKPESAGLDQANGRPGEQGGFPGGEGMTPPDGQGSFPGGEGMTPPDGQGGFPGGEGMTPPDGQGGFPGGEGMTPSDGQGGFPGGEGMTPPDGQGGFPGGEGMTPPDGQGGFPGGMGGNAKGSDLRYTDDDPNSYADIFDNTETEADDGAQTRVIAALKALSQGEADEALDSDEVIRYFVAHNFVLNYDSYTGNMLHNYFLYENGGKLSMLPWDYNLAFGAFGGMGGSSDATTLINTGIDTPLSGAEEAARPMWAWITADEDALARYHAVYGELLTDYFDAGRFEAELERLTALLRPYVEKDPTAFYTAEQFDKAVETLRQICLLRAESIRAQLDGTLSARTEEQDASARIDASGLNISDTGSHGGPDNGGSGGFGPRGGR